MKDTACGPAWAPQAVKNILFGWFFEASCIRHDKAYEKGGNELRRLKVDFGFFKAMMRDSLKTKSVVMPLKITTAVFFFLAVRIGGPLSFNYGSKKKKK